MRYLKIATLLAGFVITAQAWAGTAYDAVRARGVLRVGTTGDYKPFTFRNQDGSYDGADIFMAQRLARRLKLRLEFVPTTWKTLLPDFVAHKYDVAMGGVSVLPDRAAQGEFSTAVDVDGKRPIVRCADSDRFTSVSAIDAPDVRVIEPPGGSNEAFARANLSHAQLIIHNDNSTIFDEIIAGHADVMVTDGIEIDREVNLHPELCAAAVSAPFSKVTKAYLLPKDPEFAEAVDDFIASEVWSGDWQRALAAALHEK